MKRTTSLPIILLFFMQIIFYSSHAQTISGVINTYAAVTRISSANLTLNNATGFAAGDKILVIQMQGAVIDTSNTSSFGDILKYNGAGNYEFAMIIAVNGNNITLQYPLCRTYDVTGSVQVVKVALYNNVTVSDTLTCQPWNGGTGGVLVMEATGTVTLHADIDVSGKGFRGGANTNGGYDPFAKYWYVSSALTFDGGGQKGESIARYIYNKDAARGKQAAGGGGANPVQNGGGGGGNYGAGGLGGYGFSMYIIQYRDSSVQGIGGAALDYTKGQIFMGSGGGGGCADNGHIFSPGTNGGGIIIITAKNLIGNNHSIRSNGVDQLVATSDEGAGGSGAGGCILLNVQGYTGNLSVTTKGGKGCDNDESAYFSGACHGTGGGGGAGLLWLSLSAKPANLSYDGSGGMPGMGLNPNCVCYNTSFGATSGQTTSAPLFNLILPPLPVDPIQLTNDQFICSGSSVLLNPSSPLSYSYTWSPVDGLSCFTCANPTASPTVTTTYTAVGVNGYCTDSDHVVVTVTGIPVLAGNITALRDTICAGTPASLSSTGSKGALQWQASPLTQGNFANLTNMNDSSYATVLSKTTYFRIVAGNGACGDTSSAYKIVVAPSPVANFSYSRNNRTVYFYDSSQGATIYNWDFGDGETSDVANPIHQFNTADTFHVCLTVFNGSNCSFTICRSLDAVTGIKNISDQSGFNLFPNPFNDQFFIECREMKTSAEYIEVYDLMGKTILKNNETGSNRIIQMDFSALPQGMYLVKIVTPGESYIQLVTKN